MSRVLIVAYYFPPSGGAGVQRVLKWTKYLPQFGVEPVVLTIEAGAYPKLDPTLLEEVPAGVPVYRTRAFEPFGIYARLRGRTRQQAVDEATGHIGEASSWTERFAHWVRGNVFIPDARVGWVPFAIREGKRLLCQEGIDAILTSGPPHSTHLIGRALHRASGLPWVADFRDPWTDISYYDELPRSKAAAALDRRLERSVLTEATRVVTVSPSWSELLAGKVDPAPGRFHVIQNGYDPADFGPPPPLAPDVFQLAYVGSLYGSRNPMALWKALARLRERGAIPALRLKLVGRIGQDVQDELVATGLADIADVEPYLPHGDAVRGMQAATLLLLTIEPYRHEKGNLTGKIYEYLATGRPILALGPPSGDAATLLDETKAGAVLGRDDVEGITRFLAHHYDAWAKGAPLVGATSTEAYSRRTQAGHLADLIHTLAPDG